MTGLAGTAFLATAIRDPRPLCKELTGAVEFLVRCATPTGLITGRLRMVACHAWHGFALMFLACVYGMTNKEALRRQVRRGPQGGYAHSRADGAGGWTYTPGTGTKGRSRSPGTGLRALTTPDSSSRASDREASSIGEMPDAGGRNPVFAPLGWWPGCHLGGGRGDLYNAGQFDSTIATSC